MLCKALPKFPERSRLRDGLGSLRTVTVERRVAIIYRVLKTRVLDCDRGLGRDFMRRLRKRK
jgi:hypothetical protein